MQFGGGKLVVELGGERLNLRYSNLEGLQCVCASPCQP